MEKINQDVLTLEMPEYEPFPVAEEKLELPDGSTEFITKKLGFTGEKNNESLKKLRTRVERDASDRMLWETGFSAQNYLHGIISTSRKASIKRQAKEMKIMQAQLRNFYPDDGTYRNDWTPQKDIALHHILQMCERNEQRHSKAFKRLKMVQTRLEYPALIFAAIGSAISASSPTHPKSPTRYYASTVIQLVVSMLLAAKMAIGVDRLIPHEMRMCKGFHTLSVDLAITLTQRPEHRKQNGNLTLQEFKQRYCELQKLTEDITPGRGINSNTWQIYVKDVDLESPGFESVVTQKYAQSDYDDSISGTSSELGRLEVREPSRPSGDGEEHPNMGGSAHSSHPRQKSCIWYDGHDGHVTSP